MADRAFLRDVIRPLGLEKVRWHGFLFIKSSRKGRLKKNEAPGGAPEDLKQCSVETELSAVWQGACVVGFVTFVNSSP